MKNRFSPPGLFTTVIAASVFVISGTIGLLAYTSARSVKKENDRSIQRIQHDLRRLEQTIEAMNRRLTASGEKNPVASVQGNAMPTDGAAAVQPGGLSPKAELTRLKKLIDSTDQEQLRLKKIVESTGLDRLAKMENIDPDLLKKLYDEHSQRNIIDEHRAYLREKNDEFIKTPNRVNLCEQIKPFVGAQKNHNNGTQQGEKQDNYYFTQRRGSKFLITHVCTSPIEAVVALCFTSAHHSPP